MRVLLIVIAAVIALSACDRKGPAEKAGEQIDKAGRDLRDAVKGDR